MFLTLETMNFAKNINRIANTATQTIVISLVPVVSAFTLIILNEWITSTHSYGTHVWSFNMIIALFYVEQTVN